MIIKRLVTALAAVVLLTAPAMAGSFGVYGSYWSPEQADGSAGGGARMGFSFVKFLEMDFHGTYTPDFTTDVAGQSVEVKAKPFDGGLRVNFLPTGPVNPYVGAGVTYFFLDSDQGEIDNKSGIYGQAGLEMGGHASKFFMEAMWRKVDTTISLSSFDTDAQLDGWAGNAGVAWRWGS